MTFTKFPKIYRLGTDETEGILESGPVAVTEKLDGTNGSVWLDGNKNMHFGSRNKEVTEFRGFPEYCKQHVGLKSLLQKYPYYTIFGEWLVQHSVKYKETALNHFYAFGLFNRETRDFRQSTKALKILQDYEIRIPLLFAYGTLTKEDIMQYVGNSELTERPHKGEGVVITPDDFVNLFDNRVSAKVVIDEFSECKSKTRGIAGGFEMELALRFTTEARVLKMIHKLEAKSLQDVGSVISAVTNDILAEEISSIAKTKDPFSFVTFKHEVARLSRDILLERFS
jgi:RNA ligase